ncbi:MAG: hypothetical protein RLZZ164_438 [Actinomycetota bacterium]|jgi:membrane protein YdbS with pleckstrin-like domain
MSFSSEEYLGRIRQHVVGLVLPFAALFVAAGIVSYFANQRLEVWQLNIAYSIALVIAIAFWLVPVIKHLAFYIDVTTTRLIIRRGLFGGKTVEIKLSDITAIEQRRSRVLIAANGLIDPIELSALPRPRAFVAQLGSLGAR